MSEEILNGLNDRQQEAVLTTEGPVMVMAGAGSGKTRVLTRRIAHLILDKNVYPSQILAVTFTNKAAREMKERVAQLVNTDTHYMWISTFHSFCARFLRSEIEHIAPYTTKYQIIDDDDSEKIVRDIIKDLGYDVKDYKPRVFLKYISDEKNGVDYKINQRDYEDLFVKVKERYQKSLVEQNLLDFDDLIVLTLRILNEFSDVREKYQEKFKYILVDEFQDTNLVQYELIKILGGKYQNIFVVGDEDQSIYSFRGARVENVAKFRCDLPSTKLILLEENYRSTKSILNIANNVIKNNPGRIDKNLFTSNSNDVTPKYFTGQSSYEEELFIVDEIKKLKLEGYDYKDFAIMYRSNHLSRSIEETLNKYRLPYELYGGISFFTRKEIKDICAYLRLIISHDDDFSFERIVNEPKRKIGPAMITKLKDNGLVTKKSLFDSIDSLSASGNGYNALIDFKFTILELEEDLLNKDIPLTNIVDKILDKTGYVKMLKESGEEGEDRLENIQELKSLIKEYEDSYSDLSRVDILEEMLQNITLKTDMDNKNEDSDSIKLMTYHQAKGLEFKIVFMMAMEENIFPNQLALSENSIDEERRICYVGITRARERLYITNSLTRYVFGHQESHLESRFVSEIGHDNLERVGLVKRTIPVQSAAKQTEDVKKVVSNDLAIGDVVSHKLFGEGRVVEVKDKIVSIAFASPVGIKKMLKDHPSISKIR